MIRKTQPLQREAEAEDDVVRARHPQRAVGLEDAPGRPSGRLPSRLSSRLGASNSRQRSASMFFRN
jgi:hypothetical protein